MGPTRKRDLTAATVLAAVAGYLLVVLTYRWFPPITLLTGVSLLAVAIAEAGWAFYVRAKINDGEIGDGPGWLHPLAVARSVLIAKASAWVGALVLGWWVGVLVYLLPRRSTLRVAGEDTAGAVVAAVCALALVVAALWLQHCCRSPDEPPENTDASNGVSGGRGRVAESPKRSTREVTCGGYSRPMTDPTRSARSRRGGRRPGWLLLTVLLVLAIVASSALVFTNRVELLKLAVILALWAAVVAAFVSVIYRRQSDMDQAKVRDLKLVYDLQLDREISARREYELSVETELRRELASELRAQAADDVAGLRAELAALRANLEILFDADLSHRPALETDRTTVRAYSDWARDAETTGRVTSSRIDTDDGEDLDRDTDVRTEESPIIDVPAEPHPQEPEWVPPPAASGGAHRRPSEAEPPGWRHSADETPPHAWSPPPQPRHPSPPSRPDRPSPSPSPSPSLPSRRHRRRRTGSRLRPKDNGFPPERPAATGRHPSSKTAPQASTSARGGPPSRRCKLRPPTVAAAATPHRRMRPIRVDHRRRRHWPPNLGVRHHTPNRLRNRNPRHGIAALTRRRPPGGSLLPS